jgi:hypothetical protein
MSEPKLCPFLLMAARVLIQQADPATIAPCLKEACAMWRETRNVRINPTGVHEDREATGYCGLAGNL